MPAPLDYAGPPSSPGADRRGPQYALALSANLCGLTFAGYLAFTSGAEPWTWSGMPGWLVAVAGGLLQVGLTVWGASVSVELRRPTWYDPLVWVAWLATAGYLIALPLVLVATR